MKGLIVNKPGDPFVIADDVAKPSPSPSQLLVKSIATSINPVDGMMQGMGLLVTAWPIVLGCDAAGIVVEVGADASSSFKVGDEVCGCTRLGFPGHSTFQEYFLMDASLAIPKPKNLTIEQAAAFGVGSETASLGIFPGLKLPLLDVNHLPPSKDEWLIILGGSGNVGLYAVQLAKLSGFKVLASCSPKSAASVKNAGAEETFDYKLSEEDQLKTISSVTGGKFSRIFDTTAQSHDLALKALTEKSTLPEKFFTSTNDWSIPETFKDVHIYPISLGEIGRSGPTAKEIAPAVNSALESFVPVLGALCEAGKLRSLSDIKVVDGVGLESVLEGLALQQKGGGYKYVARIQAQ